MLNHTQITMLGSAAIDGFGETYIKRPYGECWGADYTLMCALVAMGYMKFKCCHHAPIGCDFIRRYTITDDGREALRRACNPIEQVRNEGER